MDPNCNLQDVIRCCLCETPMPSMHCDICNFYLCKACVGEHLSDNSKDHKVVPFERRRSTTQCQQHLFRICELYCDQCDIPICAICISSKEHHAHEVVDIYSRLENTRDVLQKDLQELEKTIYPKIQDLKYNIRVIHSDLEEKIHEFTEALKKHEEDWHREINTIIMKLRSYLKKIKSEYRFDLYRQRLEVDKATSEYNQTIDIIKNLLNSSDTRLVTAYKSNNSEFRKKLPPNLTVSLPKFIPLKTNSENIYKQFCLIKHDIAASLKAEDHGYYMDAPSSDASQTDTSSIDEPKRTTVMYSEFKVLSKLCSVSCLSSEEIWLTSDDNIIRLYNLRKENVAKSIHIKSGGQPKDIAVTSSGDLVYTDYKDRTVNIVKNTQIQTVIRLRGWKPLSVCSTSSGDILVVMFRYDKRTKVVRYTDFKEKQNIEFNDKGQSLYSSGDSEKYISENKNMDICVSDCFARTVVVVSNAGKFKFIYPGFSSTMKLFNPHGITTDSQSRILIADYQNNCVHVIDQSGQFLFYIIGCEINTPYDLCIDTSDNLFVTEFSTGILKKIKYDIKPYCLG